MPLLEVEAAEEETHLAVAGGSVTHPIQIRLGPIQAQILLVTGTVVASTVVASMVVDHLMIGNVRIKNKEISRFRYEK